MGRRKNATEPAKTVSAVEKTKLAGLVMKHPSLWDLSDTMYRRGDKNVRIWDEISQEMGLPAVDCKKAWGSMKDALRYRQISKRKMGKSGDAAPGDNDEEPNSSENVDKSVDSWEFWECMKFMVDKKGSRATISSLSHDAKIDLTPSDATLSEENSDIKLPRDDVDVKVESEKRKSNYEYASKKKAIKVSDEATEKLAAGITELVNLRKESVQARSEKLEFHSIYVNLDRMLKKLPMDIVEDLNMEFINLVYAALKKNQDDNNGTLGSP